MAETNALKMLDRMIQLGSAAPAGGAARPPLAGELLGARGAGDLVQLPLEELHPDPGNPRSSCDDADLDALAETMKTHGVLEPLLARPAPGGAGYEIVAGHRRYHAAKRAGLTHVPVVLRAVDKVRSAQLIENLHRKDLPPLDLAEGLARLMAEEGLSDKEAGARIQMTPREVRRYLQLREAPEVVRSALRDGMKVEIAEEGSTKAVTRQLTFRPALEAIRIFNHYAKREKGEEKKASAARVERLLRRALAQDWSLADFEREAARTASSTAAKPPRGQGAPRVFEETATRLVVYLDRLGEAETDPGSLEALAARLDALAGEIRERIAAAR